MKPNKFNIFVVVALGGVMACGPMACAQETATPTPPPPGAGNGAPGPRAARTMTSVIEKLNLTEDQKPKFIAIRKEENTQLIALRQDTSVAKEDRGAKIKEIRDATDLKLKEIFTPEQYAKWEEMRKPRARGTRPNAGTGAPAATDPGAATPAPPK